MKRKQLSILTGVAVALLCLGTTTVVAQNDNGPGGQGGPGGRRGRGNFNPEERRQLAMDNLRDEMSVTNDDEWKVIEARVQKVIDAQREVGGGFNFFRLMRPRGGNNDGNGPGQGRRGGRGMFGGQPMPELEALDKAIESNAPAEQVKAAMERYRAARKVKEAALEKAQADLKQVLTVKQEAVAVSLGLLK